MNEFQLLLLHHYFLLFILVNRIHIHIHIHTPNIYQYKIII